MLGFASTASYGNPCSLHTLAKAPCPGPTSRTDGDVGEGRCWAMSLSRKRFWRSTIQRPAVVMPCSSLKYLYLLISRNRLGAEGRWEALEFRVARVELGNGMTRAQNEVDRLVGKNPPSDPFRRFHVVSRPPPIRP